MLGYRSEMRLEKVGSRPWESSGEKVGKAERLIVERKIGVTS
jgi:hypothetical protein